jgi:hypothetical protein
VYKAHGFCDRQLMFGFVVDRHTPSKVSQLRMRLDAYP